MEKKKSIDFQIPKIKLYYYSSIYLFLVWINKFNRMKEKKRKKKKIFYLEGEKTFFANFFLSFFFFPQLSSYRTYISGMPRRWRTNWNLWMVLDSSSQRLASLLLDIENPFPSILLDSIDSFRPLTILSPVVPGSFLVP